MIFPYAKRFMHDTGGDISWISWFHDEKEYLFVRNDTQLHNRWKGEIVKNHKYSDEKNQVIIIDYVNA